jgi:ATP-dependent RNA helicase DDX56/DBP9
MSSLRHAQALREGSLAGRVLGRLAVLVLDEADLLLSYGHEADLQAIAPQVRRRQGSS